MNIGAKYDYRLFPDGEENVVLENWNYVLDRSVNVTTIVVQNSGKSAVCGLKRCDMPTQSASYPQRDGNEYRPKVR